MEAETVTETILQLEQKIDEAQKLLKQLRSLIPSTKISDDGDHGGSHVEKIKDKAIMVNHNDDEIALPVVKKETPMVNGDINHNEQKVPIPLANVPFGKSIPIALSYAFSTRNFFVIFDLNNAEEFHTKLNDTYEKSPKIKADKFEIGDYYVYLYEEDESFYRVKLIGFEEQEVLKLLFVDTGEIQIGTKQKLFHLLPEFRPVPRFSLACFVNDSWNKNFQKIDCVFPEFLSGETELEAIFSQPIEERFPVILTLKKKDGSWINISDYECDVEIPETLSICFFNHSKFVEGKGQFDKELIASGYEQLEKFEPFSFKKLNQPVTCEITKVMDINNFIIIWPENLDNFVTNFSLFYSNSFMSPKTDVQPNELIAFKFDIFCFRGIILERVENQFQILAIDLGMILTVAKDDVFKLLDQFTVRELAPFSALASIKDIAPKGDSWPSLVIKMFRSKTAKGFKMEAKSFSGGRFHVSGEIDQGRDAYAFLIKSKFGLPKN